MYPTDTQYVQEVARGGRGGKGWQFYLPKIDDLFCRDIYYNVFTCTIPLLLFKKDRYVQRKCFFFIIWIRVSLSHSVSDGMWVILRSILRNNNFFGQIMTNRPSVSENFWQFGALVYLIYLGFLTFWTTLQKNEDRQESVIIYKCATCK